LLSLFLESVQDVDGVWQCRDMDDAGGATVVSHADFTHTPTNAIRLPAHSDDHAARASGEAIIFQMAEVMVPRDLFQKIITAIAALRPLRPARC
jgi:hypothetical protein